MGHNVNLIDIILLICLIPALFGGVKSGFIKQVAALVALLAGIWAGWHFSTLFAESVNIWSDTNRILVKIISFAAVFLIVVFFVNLIGHSIHGIVNLVMLGWLDKLLGVIFAIVKYGFILSMLIYFIESINNLYSFLPRETLDSSRLYGFISSLAPTLFPFIDKLMESGKEVGESVAYAIF
jgi:membrane protein required for colicin V production